MKKLTTLIAPKRLPQKLAQIPQFSYQNGSYAFQSSRIGPNSKLNDTQDFFKVDLIQQLRTQVAETNKEIDELQMKYEKVEIFYEQKLMTNITTVGRNYNAIKQFVIKKLAQQQKI
ncbi:Hypothetical_protein [Hexamita inflata]|uniref:Hypothetical_protein n=1 Tax=Hexamita inflata TaxID=28002 RepID=A0AA86VP14_9EUKA|nr:Hypothetical protein HINF_LOCUS59598 [Hexamita inflata]